MTEPGLERSLTIDRGRHSRIVRDLVVEGARVRLRSRWVAVALVLIALVAVSSWRIGAGMFATIAVVLLVGWWVAARRSARHGLGVGQTVSVAYTDDQLTVTDATGQVLLPRGAAVLVRRTGGNVTVYGRSVSFVLPGELLTDGDVAFLEGHGPVASAATSAAPDLPLSLEVTQTVQDDVVEASTWAVVRSADFLLLYVAAGAVLLLAVATHVWLLMWLVAFFLGLALPGLFGLVRMRSSFRKVFPVGRVLRAEVTAEHLAVARLHGTLIQGWDEYAALKVTDKAVLLRARRPPFSRTRTYVLPRELFRPTDLELLGAAVRKRF